MNDPTTVNLALDRPLEALRIIWRARVALGLVCDVEVTHTWIGKRAKRAQWRRLDAWRRAVPCPVPGLRPRPHTYNRELVRWIRTQEIP